jgi:hypothetical protein
MLTNPLLDRVAAAQGPYHACSGQFRRAQGEKTPAENCLLVAALRIVFFCQQTDVIANR